MKAQITQESLLSAAIHTIQRACTPQGILASAEGNENYNRIWSRDSVIAGISGLIANDRAIIDGFYQSLYNLGECQGEYGQIPSNILFDSKGKLEKISYGGLAGRIDATSWWVIGATLYCFYTKSETIKAYFYPKIAKALEIMEVWEFNGRGLMYVPLSGNWADEYVISGYVLYDQLLRLWGLSLVNQLWDMPKWKEKAVKIHELIAINYWKIAEIENDKPENYYHSTAYQKVMPLHHAFCSLSPDGYDTRFDLMANALSLQLTVGKDIEFSHLYLHLERLAEARGNYLFPVFLPIIKEGEKDWALLAENYAYRFKNYPHHFHNGGIWLHFLGWTSLVLALSGKKELSKKINKDILAYFSAQTEPYAFYEYINSENYEMGGVKSLCFTASGIIFQHFSEKEEVLTKWKPLFSPFLKEKL